MKKKILRELVMTALAVGLLSGLGLAQGSTGVVVTADIPFSFTVGNTTLPAGKYEISQMLGTDAWDFSIADSTGKVRVIVGTEPAEMGKRARAFELTFDVFGDKHFLNYIWLEDTMYGFYVPKAKDEMTLWKNGMTPVTHTVSMKKKAGA
jgi:hypothetical protein